MAKILLKLPCSEAEVERIFSLMGSVFGTRGQAALRDLVESRLFLIRGLKKFPRALRFNVCPICTAFEALARPVHPHDVVAAVQHHYSAGARRCPDSGRVSDASTGIGTHGT
jgi:hypothetical protein